MAITQPLAIGMYFLRGQAVRPKYWMIGIGSIQKLVSIEAGECAVGIYPDKALAVLNDAGSRVLWEAIGDGVQAEVGFLRNSEKR